MRNVSHTTQTEISDDVWIHALEYLKEYQKVAPNWKSSAVANALNLEKNDERMLHIENDLEIELKNYKVLEIGSGVGSFVIAAKANNVDCYGIEPNLVGVKTSVIRDGALKDRILCGVGEQLPYKDEIFDLVVSFQVLEHTQKPDDVLRESIRVLKKNGYLYFVIPNYNSFWEGHYGLFWLPCFPKKIGKIYLKLLGRDSKFLESLNYITPKYLLNILDEENAKVVSLGIETWEKRLTSINFSTWGHTSKLMSIVKLAHRLRIVPVIKYMGKKFEFYYPIILIVKKL
jgi:SAM-dependent methyltransferase